ncbi:hypothetical protein FA10DRAFT_287012 [Acaromyces ingoldii]|uniref:Uncharacterized protein n=1 Tax=Acaromyces ingoldii TaxID=215250 RepID=A0A316YHU0_9BASI|nr:hypothetical protein FA10DRAFT_287012 [Acaromyces ingoldii]PWN89120.1 hypothetical protein FA10DRAFT_287012 [Acaromyces ingoldii]
MTSKPVEESASRPKLDLSTMESKTDCAKSNAKAISEADNENAELAASTVSRSSESAQCLSTTASSAASIESFHESEKLATIEKQKTPQTATFPPQPPNSPEDTFASGSLDMGTALSFGDASLQDGNSEAHVEIQAAQDLTRAKLRATVEKLNREQLSRSDRHEKGILDESREDCD